jgi:oligoendopeptidase F
MSDKTLKQRDQIAKEYKWNIEAMYPDESQWEKDIEECVKAAESFAGYQGRLTESAQTLCDALTEKDRIW